MLQAHLVGADVVLEALGSWIEGGSFTLFGLYTGMAIDVAPQWPALLDEPLLDSAAAAELLAVRPSWVYEAVRRGRLPHVKVGRHLRFVRSDLERWVEIQRVQARR